MIEIIPDKNEDYKPKLKMKAMLPFEYVIAEKVEFDEPITGNGQYGEWNMYTLEVSEFVTNDAKTGEKVVNTESTKVSYFASKTVHSEIKDLPQNVKFKITAEKKEGKMGEYNVYKVELLDKVEGAPLPSAKNVEVPVDDKIKAMKAGGVSADDVAALVTAQYDVTADFVKKRYEVL